VKRASQAALAFVASQLVLWTGCNAILGNGYGAFDESAVGPGGLGGEGGPEGDAAGGGEGGLGSDGNTTGDGDVGDAFVADGRAPDGAVCPRMKCPTKLASVVGPQRLAVDATGVYWTTAADVGRANLDGTGATPPIAVPGGPIVPSLTRGIALQGGVPYLTAADRGAAKCTANLSSCINTPFIGSAGTSSSLAVDASKVYVGIYDDGSGSGGLWQTDLNGASPTPYTTPLDQVLGLRVVNSVAYFQTATDLKYVPSLSGSTFYAIASSGDVPVAFDVVGSNLVYATAAKLLRVCATSPTTSCNAPVLQARMLAISAVIIDGTQMIWAEGGANGAVYRAALSAGASVELLADGQASPSDLAVDGTSIYWANHGDSAGVGGAIMKLPK